MVCARISLENYSNRRRAFREKSVGFRRVQEPAEPTESISAGTIREAGFFRQNIPTMFRVDRPASPNAAGRKAPPLAAGGRSQAFTGTSAVRRTAHPRSAHLSNGSGELSRRRISQNDASEFPFAPRFPPLRLHPGRRAPAEPNRSFVSFPIFYDLGFAAAPRSAKFEKIRHCPRLFVSLTSSQILRLGIIKLTFASALAYSYLWLTPKILPFGIITPALASALTYSYL